jgi:hypothetical protein
MEETAPEPIRRLHRSVGLLMNAVQQAGDKKTMRVMTAHIEYTKQILDPDFRKISASLARLTGSLPEDHPAKRYGSNVLDFSRAINGIVECMRQDGYDPEGALLNMSFLRTSLEIMADHYDALGKSFQPVNARQK